MTNLTTIEVKDYGLSKRMMQFPEEFEKVKRLTMEASLIVIHENIPPYPQVENPKRTGTLGRTLGSSIEGSKRGNPEIYEVKKLGDGIEGRFGTKLEYAQYVIGEKQTWFHSRWWTMGEVAKKIEGKIAKLWSTAAEKMVKFLEKKGL